MKLNFYSKNFRRIIMFSSIFLFISCVYFNTFYNAKVAYKDAQRIINLMDYTETSLPPEAKRLLDLSIANSRVVLEKYSKSKYVEEAYYLLASSTFLKEDYISSKEYLNTLIENYPNGKYFNEANLRLAFIDVRKDSPLSADSIIQNLKANYTLNKYETYLLNMIDAEIYIINNDIELAYDSYNNAIKSATNDSQRIKIYNKLIQISEKEKDYGNLLIFIDELYKNLSLDSDKKEIKLLSIEYNKRLKKYDYLIIQIQDMLNQSLFEDKRLFLSVELAKAYYHLGDYLVSEELLLELVDLYSKKNETAEAYYYLAKITIKNDFNLEIIKELLTKSKTERSNSKYGKLSKALIKKLEALEDITYEYTNSISEEIVDDKKLSSDSLLFDMGQIYYFDFNQIDSAISRHSELVSKFPNSKFSPKSAFILSVLDSTNNVWGEMLSNKYSGYNFENPQKTKASTINYSQEYYEALSLLELGFHEEAYPILKQDNLNNNNKESSFYLGYINEVYTLDTEEMISYYIQYLNEGKEEDRKNQVKEKLSIYYYMFSQKLKYFSSSNLLSACLENEDQDSLLYFASVCLLNANSETSEYSEDSLKIKYSDMKILNQSWNAFKRNVEFINDEYEINADSLEIHVIDYILSDSKINYNTLQINQLTNYINLYDNLETEIEIDINISEDEEEKIPEKSMPFQNLKIEDMDFDKLDLLKK